MLNISTCHSCRHWRRTSPSIVVCTDDPESRDIIAIAAAGKCPLKLFTEPEDHSRPVTLTPEQQAAQAQLAAEQKAKLAAAGNLHWRMLHTFFAAEHIAGEAERFLESWEAAIPRFGCQCAAEYQKLKAANPPGGDWFEWSVRIHDAVNARLGKPIYGIERARALYQK